MTNNQHNPLTQVARQQMQSFAAAGEEAYRDWQLLRAAELFDRALKLAVSLGDTRAIVEYRFWCGDALMVAGKLRQALAALAPTLQVSVPSGNAADVYNTLITYLNTAQTLPVSLRGVYSEYV